jgi:hypothetical protein
VKLPLVLGLLAVGLLVAAPACTSERDRPREAPEARGLSTAPVSVRQVFALALTTRDGHFWEQDVAVTGTFKPHP